MLAPMGAPVGREDEGLPHRRGVRLLGVPHPTETDRRRVYTYPSKRSLASVMEEVRALTRRSRHRTQTSPQSELGNDPSSPPPELGDQQRRGGNVPATSDAGHSIPLPARQYPCTMDECCDGRITRTSGLNLWRAGCGESRTSGSAGGPEKPTSSEAGRAARSDPPLWEANPLGRRHAPRAKYPLLLLHLPNGKMRPA